LTAYDIYGRNNTLAGVQVTENYLRNEDEETLTFVVSIMDDDDNSEAAGTKGIFGQRDLPAIRQIPVAILRENLHRTVNELGSLFRNLATPEDTMILKQVEVSFEVTASGKVALLGASAEASGKGAITLTFAETESRG
jgi:hypothetical protein